MTYQTDYFKGKNVVVTGRMHKTRAEIHNELVRLGANIQESIRGNTDLLICGADVGATKFQAAERKGVAMLNAEDYRQIVSGTFKTEPPKPKMTHEEFVASLPDNYGAW